MEKLKLYPNMKIYHWNKKKTREWFKQEKNGTPFPWVELTFGYYEGNMLFRVFIFVFCLELTVTKITWMKTTSLTVMVIFLNLKNYREHWHRPKLQLKILLTWMNICANSFLVKYETKFDEGAWKIISCTKIQACT